MQFSDTTDKNGLVQRFEFWTNLGDGAVSGNNDRLKQATVHINQAYHELHMQALKAQDGVDVDDHRHDDRLVFESSMTTNRDQQLPAGEDALMIKRLDVTYDGENWNKAQVIDSGEIEMALENVDDHASKDDPHYDPQGDYFNIYPKASSDDVSNGAKFQITIQREALEFDSTDTTETPFLPSALHDQIAIRAAYKWVMVNKADNGSLLSRLEGQIKRGDDIISSFYGKRLRDRQYRMTSSINHKDYE